ncbi:MAG: hypothetical protein ACKPJD_27705, partial [Planctomycetaceae bacterium]
FTNGNFGRSMTTAELEKVTDESIGRILRILRALKADETKRLLSLECWQSLAALRGIQPTPMQRRSLVKTLSFRAGQLLTLTALLASTVLLTGCQTTIGGQTLPSPDYLTDDVQFYPAGPEFRLTNQVEASRKQAADTQTLESSDN